MGQVNTVADFLQKAAWMKDKEESSTQEGGGRCGRSRSLLPCSTFTMT